VNIIFVLRHASFFLNSSCYKCFQSDLLITSALNTLSELLPNLYYSPIKKLENIILFKIVRQKRPWLQK
jgi:hypothetical protein